MDNPSMNGLDMDLAHAAEEIQRWQRAAEANIGENVRLRHEKDEGWKEAAIAWEVCASIHEKWAKGKDALYSTRHADFVKHAADARAKLTPDATALHAWFKEQLGEPVMEFVQSPNGNYIEMKWQSVYEAKLGDKLYSSKGVEKL